MSISRGFDLDPETVRRKNGTKDYESLNTVQNYCTVFGNFKIPKNTNNIFSIMGIVKIKDRFYRQLNLSPFFFFFLSMTLSLLSRTLLRRRSSSSARKLLSTSTGGSPLLLALPETPYDESPPRILFPQNSPIISVSSISEIVQAVEQHYELTTTGGQFVGGMGESDAGVWFVPTNNSDPLRHFNDLLKASIEEVKQSRHGVPFGVYTSGTLHVEAKELSIFSTIHVSLLAATPNDYCEAAGVFRAEFFGDVCNFLVNAQEEGLPVHAGVLKKFAAEGRDLATTLGAQHVDVHDS